MPLALSEPEVLKIATAIVGALAASVVALWWRSERAHERRHAWSVKIVDELVALLERRRVTDAEIAAALKQLAPADHEQEEEDA